MGIVSNIVCKTVGFAGVGAIVYDAYHIGKEKSVRVAQKDMADRYEKIYAVQRTASTESHVSNAIQNGVANWRMENPIFPVIGRIKGFIEGSLESMGENIIPVIFSSMALLGKNTIAKIGAWGLVGCGVYTVLKEGFGIGKTSPIEK